MKNYLKLVYEFRQELMMSLPKSKRVIGFGAARSANFLIEVLQLQDVLEVVLDDNPEKCGKYFYGSEIPIIKRASFEFEENDLVIPLAWIHSRKIAEQFREKGIGINYLSFYPSVSLEKL